MTKSATATIVSVTGPNSLDHGALLLGAKPPDWFGGWNASATFIIEKLQEGVIPHTNIAALAFKIVVFYSRQNNKNGSVVWSSPQEVFGLMRNRFETAALETMLPELQEFLASFDPLIDAFCISQPGTQIVWTSEQETALSHGFGMCHEPCTTLSLTVDSTERDDDAWDGFVNNSVTREALQTAQFDTSAIDVLCGPATVPATKDAPATFNFL